MNEDEARQVMLSLNDRQAVLVATAVDSHLGRMAGLEAALDALLDAVEEVRSGTRWSELDQRHETVLDGPIPISAIDAARAALAKAKGETK